jgi:pyridoxamine 5'-phosphate oxidase
MSASEPPPTTPSPQPARNPLFLFSRWYDEAVAAGVQEPEAMALATATPDGRPSVRFVLFRGLTGGGLRFFTNLESRKASELLSNPRAAVVFHWAPLGRQVRIEGRVERLSADEDDAYFASRPRGHRLAALASPQSRPIEYADLMARYEALERTHKDDEVPRPPSWGGFRLTPEVVELWVRKDNRLHDRTVYRMAPTGTWEMLKVGP